MPCIPQNKIHSSVKTLMVDLDVGSHTDNICFYFYWRFLRYYFYSLLVCTETAHTCPKPVPLFSDLAALKIVH